MRLFIQFLLLPFIVLLESRYAVNSPTTKEMWAAAPAAETKLASLALQGGGAHGAFTWGVLDRCSYATAALRPYDRQGMPTFIQFFEFFDCVPIPSVDCPVASVPIVKTYI
jgi:hypothetical protein